MDLNKKHWVPEITYEESEDDEGVAGTLPLIYVPQERDMPTFLMMWEARDTGEIEPGSLGEDVPVVNWELRQYARMDVLKDSLSPSAYDDVRKALGLKPLAEAVVSGHTISQGVRENLAKKELNTMGKQNM